MKPYSYQTQKDKTIVLKLPAKPSCGYVWELDLSEQPNLTLLKEEYLTENNNMDGHNCFQLFYLKIKKKGTYQFKAIEKRPFENKNLQELSIEIEHNV